MLDVLIVGAGLSGLYVAKLLTDSQLSVKVLEARSRVGGRLHSSDTGLDLGATWFWANEPKIRELVVELNVPVFDQALDGDAVVENGQKQVQKIRGNPVDFDSFRFKDGANSLARALAERLPSDWLRLEQAVVSVARSPTVVDSCEAASNARASFVVTTADGTTFEARNVVLAIPPALAAERIAFQPALPADLQTVMQECPVWFGDMRKVVLQYEKPFWRDQGLAGAAASRAGPVREYHNHEAEGRAAIFGFAPAPRRGTESNDLTRESVLEQAVRLFGAEAANPLHLIIQDWRREQFTSPSNVAQLSKYKLFGHEQLTKEHDGLFFTSTETSDVYGGHMEGALQAAARTAEALKNANQAKLVSSATSQQQ